MSFIMHEIETTKHQNISPFSSINIKSSKTKKGEDQELRWAAPTSSSCQRPSQGTWAEGGGGDQRGAEAEAEPWAE